MRKKQLKNAGVLFLGQLLIKGSSFIKQILLAFFLGVSAQVDLLLVAQIVPAILASMIAGGAGEILVTTQKKGKIYNSEFIVLFIFTVAIITILLGGIYLGTLPLFSNLFEVSPTQSATFWSISILVVISKLPLAFVSGLKNLLYAKDKYNFFVISTLVAEIAGILTIVFLVDEYGIVAFAIGLIVTPTVNALLFMYAHQLQLSLVFKVQVWKAHKDELALVLKRTFSLSLQTLLNHLSTFWERTLSFRFLSPGFLSALNYSKSLTELPKMALLSSVLTTTYIEQVNHKTEALEEYTKYSGKMEKILSELAFIFQLLSLIFAPLILILFFKRGAFDAEAVERTFIIYQVLTVGFLPGLMMNFLSRTMYIETEYKKLFYVILVKFLIEVAIMVGFVHFSSNAIPVALVTGKFFVSIILFFILWRKRPEMFNVPAFIKLYLISLSVSIIFVFINLSILPLLLDKTTWEIILYYIPVGIVVGSLMLYILKKRYLNHLSLKFLKRK